MTVRVRGSVALAVATAFLGFVVFWRGPHDVLTWVDDLTELAVAAWASAEAAATSRRHGGSGTWRALSVASGSWAVGQAVWSWYELLGGRDAPLPSLADVGFLGFPIAAVVGLWLLNRPDHWSERVRVLVDGALIAASLLLVSWSTVLGSVVHAGEDNGLALLVSVAYPLGDVLVGTALLLSVPGRRALGPRCYALLAAGLAGLAVADSGYAYLDAVGRYHTGSVVDVGWVAGFALLAAAAGAATAGTGAPAVTSPRLAESTLSARSLLFLPYVAVLAAVGVVAPRVTRGLSVLEAGLTGLVLSSAFLRQWLMVLENQALVRLVRAREDELRFQAFHDPLTELANRALFSDRVTHAAHLHGRDGRPLSLLYLDLDGFKAVNDLHGHAVGDTLLRVVAARLGTALRAGDTVARLGGDEFAVLLEDDRSPLPVAERLVAEVARPFELAVGAVQVGVSVGVTQALPGEPCQAEDLLAQADRAMYSAKRRGRGTVVVHDPDAGTEESVAAALAACLRHGELRVAYQPIVDLRTGHAVAVEALARWTHPRHGEVPPATFVPVAEAHGLLGQLTRAVLHRCLAELAPHARAGLHVSVNVAPAVLTAPGFVLLVREALAAHAVPPPRLVVELTETGAQQSVDLLAERVLELRAQGVRVALDDFGTGYNGLALLDRLSVTTLKTDRTSIERLLPDPDRSLVRATQDLARLHRLAHVVEGVETLEQLRVVGGLGVRLVQGYVFSPAVPLPQLPALLSRPLRPRPRAVPPLAVVPSTVPSPAPLSDAGPRVAPSARAVGAG